MFLPLVLGACEGTEKDDPVQLGVGSANIQLAT